MKTWIKLELTVLLLATFSQIVTSCQERTTENKKDLALNAEKAPEKPKKALSEAFKKYWYAGEAEITSYKLQQARYGETRDGEAVLIYVTEPFLAEKQVKADGSNSDNIPVLKLNSTKNYLTGIYPYSIMSSSFYPVYDNQHAVKLSFSSQEWCGQVYAQLNNREKFDVMSHSYFEGEADQNLKLEKTILENELWNKIRISPESLPVGDFNIVPSLEYIRLSHKKLKAYKATITLNESSGLGSYKITYPELQRTLEINFATSFPHHIDSWSETSVSGYGPNKKEMTSTATKMKTLKTPYWQQNGNKDLSLRDSLGLLFMEEFIGLYKNEMLATAITIVVLVVLKFITDKTIRKIGRISDIVEARTLLIRKYASILLTLLGLGLVSFIWGVNYKEVGTVFASVFAIIGVALFAQWSILSNITAGVILFFSFPFKIGDRVKIIDKDIESEEPYLIEDIRAFHVSLRKDNGELLVYPNSLMMQKAVTLLDQPVAQEDEMGEA